MPNTDKRGDLALAALRIEQGETGTQIYGGRITNEDPNPNLTPEEWRGSLSSVGVAERMRRTDSYVAALVALWELSITSLDWEIEAASDDPKAEEIADFVRFSLFEYMRPGWARTLRQIVQYPWRGFQLFEIVMGNAEWNGRPMWSLSKLAPRAAKTVEKWTPTEHGELEAVSFYRANALNTSRHGREVSTEIDSRKLVHFVHQMDGSNFEGLSILRPAYFPFRLRERGLKIAGIWAERCALPIPKGTIPEDVQPDSEVLTKFRTMLRELRAHERSYIYGEEGWDVEWLTVDSKGFDSLNARLDALGRDIVRAGLGQQLVSGDNGVGSFAKEQITQNQLLMALTGVADNIAETLSDGPHSPIGYLVRLNFGEDAWRDHAPRLVHSSLVVSDPTALVGALAQAAEKSLINPDQSVSDAVRDALDLPREELPEEPELEPEPEPEPEPPAPDDDQRDAEEGAEAPPADDDREDAEAEEPEPPQAMTLAQEGPAVPLARSGRPLTETELCLDIDGIEAVRESLTERTVNAGEKSLQAQALPFFQMIERMIKEGRAEEISALQPPRIDAEFADATFRKAVERGGVDVEAEIGRLARRKGQEPPRREEPAAFADGELEADEIEPEKRINARKNRLATLLGAGLLAAAIEAAEASELGATAPTAESLATSAAAVLRGRLKSEIAGAVSGLYAIGRLKGGQDVAGPGAMAVYSNAPEPGVCDECAALNGREFEVGSAEFAEAHPPLANCLSTLGDRGNLCRCVMIWIPSDLPSIPNA